MRARTYFRKNDEVCTLLVPYVCARACACLRSFTSSTAAAPNQGSEDERRAERAREKKETEPVSEKINGATGREWRGGERKRKRLSKSNKFRGINVQTSPGISKGVPDSKLFKSTVQSGDTSIRISNSDRIDRPTATAEAEDGRSGI